MLLLVEQRQYHNNLHLMETTEEAHSYNFYISTRTRKNMKRKVHNYSLGGCYNVQLKYVVQLSLKLMLPGENFTMLQKCMHFVTLQDWKVSYVPFTEIRNV